MMSSLSLLLYFNNDIECGKNKTPVDDAKNFIEDNEMSKEDIKKRNNMMISCVFRFVLGGFAIVVTFLLALSSTYIVMIILNFLAVSFISTLDNCVFELLKKGKFGNHLELEAKRIQELYIPEFMICTDKKLRDKFYWSTISAVGVVLARSEWIHALYSTYITGTDRPYWLDAAYNTRYAVKYPVFAQFSTPIGAQNQLIY
jgi:hypothetical protein